MRHVSHNCKTLFSFNGSLLLMAVTCHVMPERKGHAIDCEESLFFFRFSEVSTRARASGERRSRETWGTRLYLWRIQSRAWSCSCLAPYVWWTKKKKETVRSLDRWGHARISLFNIMQVLWLAQKYSYFAVYRHTVQFSSVHGNYNDLELPVLLLFPWLF